MAVFPVNMAREDAGDQLKKPLERPRLLRLILIGLFLYGGFSYSLSLLEYTFSKCSVKPVFGVAQTYIKMTAPLRQRLTPARFTVILPL